MFLTGFAQIFLSEHATCTEYTNPTSEAIPRGSPDVHYPAAAEGLPPPDLQQLVRWGEVLPCLPSSQSFGAERRTYIRNPEISCFVETIFVTTKNKVQQLGSNRRNTCL